jgi:hypothetical protein
MSDWRKSLGSFIEKTDRAGKKFNESAVLARFISTVVTPAFNELREVMEAHDRTVSIRSTEAAATITVSHEGDEEITYRVQSRMFPAGLLPFAEVRFRERKGLRFVKVESMLRAGKPDYSMNDIAKEEIIQSFMDHYMRRVESD